MNKVIFICLLSFSMCFSAPADPPVSGQQTTPDPKITVPPVDSKTVSAVPLPHNETPTESKSAPATNTVPATISQTNQTTPNSTAIDNKTDKQKPEDKAAPAKQPQDAKEGPSKTADDKPVEPKGHEEKPAPAGSSNSTDVKPDATDKPNNSSKPDEKPTPKPEVTTDKNAVHPTTTTVAPKTDDKKEVVLQSRGFDGPSFFGGIILTLGLLAIGFIGFKYYRTQTERNYHTL